MTRKIMPRRLYFAYGANTNTQAMKRRCPRAVPHGAMLLADHRLMFRGVADVVPEPGRSVFGALWWITEQCEDALDLFEGFPNLYVKQYGRVHIDGVSQEVMFYVMREDRPAAPPFSLYEDTLRLGYENFGLPQEQIDLAIEEGQCSDSEFAVPELRTNRY